MVFTDRDIDSVCTLNWSYHLNPPVSKNKDIRTNDTRSPLCLHFYKLCAKNAPGLLSQGVKLSECEADHPHPSSSEVKNTWKYTSTPHTPSQQYRSTDNTIALLCNSSVTRPSVGAVSSQFSETQIQEKFGWVQVIHLTNRSHNATFHGNNRHTCNT